MARRLRQLVRCAALAVLITLVPAALLRSTCAAPTPSPSLETPHPANTPDLTPTPPPAPRPSPTEKPKPSKPDEWTEARRLFEQLSPDQKKKFLDNLDQWNNMPPGVRDLFRDRYVVQREKIAQEIQDAINKSGLRLDDDQREVYALRYTQERRKIEDTLRKEMDHKRQSMVGDMLAHLKIEFASTPPPPPKPATPTPH